MFENQDGEEEEEEAERGPFGGKVIKEKISDIPPPIPLLPKSVAPLEDIRSGGLTPFIKLSRFSTANGSSKMGKAVDVAKLKSSNDANNMLNEQSLMSLITNGP